jgi:Protein of unknown function (DUF2948)
MCCIAHACAGITPDMPKLKIAALDAEDLVIVAAHLQDAVVRMGDVLWQPKQRLLAMAVNRFDALEPAGRGQPGVRRRALLRVERALGARIRGLPISDPNAVLSLLTVRFEPAEAPGGTLILVFSGGAEIALTVECIELAVADLGPAWGALSRPDHSSGQASGGGSEDP